MLKYDEELHSCYMAYMSYMTDYDDDLSIQSYTTWRRSTDPKKEIFVMGWMARKEYSTEPGYKGDVEDILDRYISGC